MLKLTNITKRFTGCFEPILDHINLELKCGDFCIVIGSNGAGKSTLMRTILGEYEIDSGHIYINGADYTTKNRSCLIASVVQDISKGTIPEMTLLENITLSSMRGKKARFALYSRYEPRIMLKIQELGIGLEKYANQPLSILSGGQRQIIATLMAVHSKPQILLLDEHTSALDPKMQKLLMEYTASAVIENNITSLMITHKLDEAIKYGNRLLMMHKGRIILDIAGTDKDSITVDTLLHIFHKYEGIINHGAE